MLGTDFICELDLLLFEVQMISGKGKGFVAHFNITKDTHILYENPFFIILHLSLINQMESNIAMKLKLLSKIQQ